MELGCTVFFSFYRRTRDRRLLSTCADVYRRDCACEVARPPSGIISIQCGIRYSRGLLLKLPDRSPALWSVGMALGVRRDGNPCGRVLRYVVHHPQEPALAGKKRSRG